MGEVKDPGSDSLAIGILQALRQWSVVDLKDVAVDVDTAIGIDTEQVLIVSSNEKSRRHSLGNRGRHSWRLS